VPTHPAVVQTQLKLVLELVVVLRMRATLPMVRVVTMLKVMQRPLRAMLQLRKAKPRHQKAMPLKKKLRRNNFVSDFDECAN
jgi:hypothetical protein